MIAGNWFTASQPADPIGALTRRERQIGEALARGASNKLIARELDIAETTVKVHVQSILRKLGLGSRVQIAVAFAERRPRDGVPPADDTA
jgi:two-component system nitrate/nitrite response regulator NarL